MIEVVIEEMVGRTEFLTAAIASEPWVGKRNPNSYAGRIPPAHGMRWEVL